MNSYPPPYGPPPSHNGTMPSYAPIHASIPPAPPTPPRRNTNGLILAAALGAVGLAVVSGGVAYAVASKKPVALPIDAKLLPPQTSEIGTQLIEATREPDEAVKAAYLGAELGATLCRPGAYDPARRLESIGSGSTRAAKELFFDKEKLAEMAQLLDCGAYLAASLDSPYQTAISYEDGDHKQVVSIGHFRFATLPPSAGFSPQSYRTVSGYCQPGSAKKDPFALNAPAVARPGYPVPVAAPSAAKADDTTCEENDHGAFAQGTTWFIGRRSSLETMAHAVTHPREELNARLGSIQEAAKQTEGLPVVRLQASPKSSREFFTAPCYMGASQSAAPFTAFVEGCFPGKSLDGTLSEIDAKLRAAAFETDGDVAKAGSVRGDIIFVARDDETAKEVEKDVREVVSEWKAHLESNEAKLMKQSRELATTSRQKKFLAVSDRWFSALEHAKVLRSGRSIKVAWLEKLGNDDKMELEDADKSTVEKRRAVAEVLSAIQAKKPLPERALGTLVGASWGKFLAGPPPAMPTAIVGLSPRIVLSTDECRKLQARVAWFSTTDKAFDAPGARTMLLDHKYASCSTRPMVVESSQKACLDSFRSASEYAACATTAAQGLAYGEPPESEFGERARH